MIPTTDADVSSSQQSSDDPARRVRWVAAGVLICSSLLAFTYTGLSLVIATQLVYIPQKPVTTTPGAFGMQYRDVTFPSRGDGIALQGWFIPGHLPDGTLTASRTLIFVHGTRTNRADPITDLLQLQTDLAKHGFAILAFDMQGMGDSPPAPLSLGYFEQNDVLGAVDFLRTGPLHFPQLGRPHTIGGWGISMGGATLLLVAAHEPAIRAVASDSAYADIIPILQREIPKGSHLPAAFTPGVLLATQAIYGMNFFAVRPVDVVAGIAPRPLLFIHSTDDQYVPFSNCTALVSAASTPTNAQVQQWVESGAKHGEIYKLNRAAYVEHLVAFFTASMGTDPATA
jgi:uncharacterized protein